MEEWKAVSGYEGLYEVSNTGKVLSLNYGKTKNPKLLKQYVDRYGYLKVVLYKHAKPHYMTVHRLVAKEFVSNPDNKNVVDHIDCNTQNNNFDNLRWVTIRENNMHSHDLNRQLFNAKKIVAIDPNGNKQIFDSQRLAEKITGIKQYAISRVINGRYQKYKGWSFKNVDT